MGICTVKMVIKRAYVKLDICMQLELTGLQDQLAASDEDDYKGAQRTDRTIMKKDKDDQVKYSKCEFHFFF
jgi:hypothetical protein